MSQIAELSGTQQERIPRKRPTPQQKRNVRECYITGQHSLSVCAQKHGVSEATCYNWSDQEDWGDLRRAFDHRQQEKLMEMILPAETQAPQPPITHPKGSQQEKLATLETQLAKLDEALAECDAKSYQSLWKAKSLALDAWALLTGFPRPGVRKQSKSRSSLPDVQPISPDSVSPAPRPDPQEPNG